MKKLYFTEIDDQFDSKNDMLLGPWCFLNPKAEGIHFSQPYTEDEVLPMHSKLFNLTFFLLNRDVENREEKLKKIYYLLLQKDYLLFVFFAFSRYRVLKKILETTLLDKIIFENVDKPKKQDIISLYFGSGGTGYLAFEILKCLIEEKNIRKFKNTNKTSEVINREILGGTIKNFSFLSLKTKIKKRLNYFCGISGVYFLQGVLLSFFYNMLGANNKNMYNFVFYDPQIEFDDETLEFVKIFDKISDLFIDKEKTVSKSQVSNITIKYPSFFYNNSELSSAISALLENKTRFIIAQHGAWYATIKKHFHREIEYSFTSFVTWGKKYVSYINRKNIINNLPSPHLSVIANSYIFKGQKNIVWVTGVHYKGGDGLEYLYGADVLEYIEKKIKFYKCIEGPLKEAIICKGLKQSSLQFYDEMQSILGTKYVTDGTAIELMYDAKLVFVDYYGTPFYEAMSMNVPVVLGLFECEPLFTDDATIIFQKFEDAGVMYRTPEAAAQFLNEMYHKDIKQWWYDEKIQSVRREFLEMYANNKPYFWPWLKAILKREI